MPDFFRVQLGIVSRAEGHSAAKRSAYQSCGIVIAHDGERFDFRRKAAEHVRTIMLTPPNAPDWTRYPEVLWRLAGKAEKRIDAQEARIMDFSMPRAIPPVLWEACVRHVYEPFFRMGMVIQIDIHDSAASDGGRNINVHGLATLREIDGDGFAARKNRTWNDVFRERNGRTVREQFAGRLTEFCRAHGVDYEGDARPNADRNLPGPEPELPRWNFEALKRNDEMPEALATLLEHRRRRRIWEKAKAEQDAAGLDLRKLETETRKRRQRRIVPTDPAQRHRNDRDRRAAILRAWHGGEWVDADAVAEIASARHDAERGCLWIALRDGSTLIDRGEIIALRGPITWRAAVETAAAAERHGWTEINVYGDQAYKDAVSVAAMLRGIEVANHTLSPAARKRFEELAAERAMKSTEREKPKPSRKPGHRHESRFRSRSSRDIHQEIAKRAFVPDAPQLADPDTENPTLVLKPRHRDPEPRPRGSRGNPVA